MKKKLNEFLRQLSEEIDEDEAYDVWEKFVESIAPQVISLVKTISTKLKTKIKDKEIIQHLKDTVVEDYADKGFSDQLSDIPQLAEVIAAAALNQI